MPQITKLLVANRGEIAVRILRTARNLGIPTVLTVSEVDRDSLAARTADEVITIGPAPAQASYLNPQAILDAATASGANAVHPGYGFLSENADFARRVQAAGLIWVGPDAKTISTMGDKIAARTAARAAGVPVILGSDGPLAGDADALAVAETIGFPLVIKAAAGGGGRGIRLVTDPAELQGSLDLARSEAGAVFGDPTVYLEQFITHARHVEVQLLADGKSAIHLGDRDCSLQRRSQKVIEEAPAPDLPADTRAEIRESSVALALACGYKGVGTVEFLYDPARGRAAFIEMNTRLQVEHPVTEAITGLDLVEEQLRIAQGEALRYKQADIGFRGCAVECRVNAEDPARNFFPSPGRISLLQWPEDDHVRVDSGVEEGDMVAPFYDSMVAKVIAAGVDRAATLEHMRRALSTIRIEGISTTLPLLRELCARPELADVSHHTTFIESTAGILEAPA